MTPAVHADRLRGALWGMFVGDALAVPAHWYCYIEHSFPAVLYLAARYPDDFEVALVANTNVGGDNCHRGAVLGALLGAALGYRAIPDRLIHGLRSRAELSEEIECFIARFA